MDEQAFIFDQKPLIWIFGSSASGKTTLLERFKSLKERTGCSLLLLRDLEEILGLMREDTDEQFHRNLPNGDFQITDSFIYEESLRRLCKRARRSMKTYHYIAIEVTCGKPLDVTVDITISTRLRTIPKTLHPHSTFLYIMNPFARRKQFNTGRPPALRIPDALFYNYYRSDDFDEVRKNQPSLFHVIDNTCTINSYLRNIDRWFFSHIQIPIK